LAGTLADIRRSGFSFQEDAPKQFFQAPLNCFKNRIVPQLTQEGYELIRPRIENPNDYRLKGSEYVTLVDPHDHATKIISTQG